jgi:hypothetical protein
MMQVKGILWSTFCLFLLIPGVIWAQWVQDTVLYPQRGVWSMVTLGNTLYASANGSILRSTDEGNTWQNSGNGLIPDYAYMPFTGSGHFFLTLISGVGFPGDTNFGKLFRSTDAGATWLQVNNLAPFTIFGDALMSIGNSFYASGNEGLFRSTDSGETWTVSTNSANSGLLASCHTYCFLHLGEKTFAGSNSGIFVTNDSGESWVPLPSNDTLRNIRFLASLGPYIFAATEDSLYRSADSGRSWMNIWNLINPLWRNFSFGEEDGNLLVCSGQFPNVYRSSDSGLSWNYFGQSVNSGICNIGPFYSTQNFMYYNSVGEYLYRRPLSDFNNLGVVSSNISASSPQIQSYPNPFSQSTQITFTSQAAGYAEVSIVNMLGVEVARLFSGELDVGGHNFLWSNPTGLPDGTYECLVRMNGQVEKLPVVLMK